MKLVLPERGSHEARDLYLLAKSVWSSRLLVPEAHAALSRATRLGRFSPRVATAALASAREFLGEVQPIELDADLAARAGALAFQHGLRGYDAVHLASYQLIETGGSILVAADGELARTATAVGHAVAVPGA